jgi:CRISPR system Cascade subunit CasC
MFIQIHTLTGYSGVLLNRDDTGMAKRLPYGDAIRTRASSQFAKRKIRKAEGEFNIASLGEVAVRSRESFKREIALPLITEGHDEAKVIAVTLAVMDAVFKPSAGALKDRKEKQSAIDKGEKSPIELLSRNEINVLSRSELRFLRGIVEAHLDGDHAEAMKALERKLKDKDFAANLKEVGQAMSLDVAMFGRMVTGDALSSVDAAVHVAHALTTHAQAVETDFVTAVDDLVTGDEDNGGGHLGEAELTSPMLYGYYVVD